MIIGISGKKQSGKDTFLELANQIRSEEGRPLFKCKKFADKVKEICALVTCRPLYMFYDAKYYNDILPEYGNMTIRQLQQKVGTDLFRQNLHPDTWINALNIETFKEDEDYIITDVRFKNEAKRIKSLGGILVRVNRSNSNTDKHPSETGLDDYEEFDYIIQNDGTLDEYKEKIKSICIQY